MENKINKDNKSSMKVMTFSADTFDPSPRNNKKLSANMWGRNNEYSKFLKDLYTTSGSPLHRKCIDKKVRFISGNGIKIDGNLNIKRFNKEVKELARNYEIFNCFAVIVGYNRAGEVSTFKSVNIENLAFFYEEGSDEKGFWVSRDFKRHTRPENEPVFYPLFDPQVKNKKSIYFYSEEDTNWKFPEFHQPNYHNGISWIRQSTVAGKYQLDNMTSGFEGSYLINFPTGEPSADEMDENYNDFMENYTGPNAQKIILSYTEPDGEQPTITAIPNDNNDEKFLETLKMADIQTVDANHIPIPMMILHGQTLGGTDERLALMEEFQIDYVTPRQEDIEFAINEILSNVNVSIKLGTYFDNINNKELMEEEDEE